MEPRVSAILLAAGYGTRLYPLTRTRPKALLPMGREVVLDVIFRALAEVPRLSQTVLVTNHRFAPDFQHWGRKRPYRFELVDDGTSTPETRLGAIRDVLVGWQRLPETDDVLVVGTDNLFTGSLEPMVRFAWTKSPSATVAVARVSQAKEASRFGVIEMEVDGRVIRCLEKPAHPPCLTVGLCLYYFPSSCRTRMEAYVAQSGSGDAPGYFIEWLAAREAVYATVMEGMWCDIGSQDAYDQAVRDWKENKGAVHA
ncbi:MAG: nucleotidyltransferase family protein [Candidatus Omnitrophica bacterium]|nr:nucleotidyltransferase family protein [Candidatus Omnitrophota bacterium]